MNAINIFAVLFTFFLDIYEDNNYLTSAHV